MLMFNRDTREVNFVPNLTHFSPVFHFYTPWKRHKTFGFLMSSGDIEMEHSTEMG